MKLKYVLLLCSLVTPSLFAEQIKEPSIVTHKINDNLFVLLGGNGQGAHVGLSIGEEEVMLIDSMMEDVSDKLLTSIKAVTNKPIRFVINTHDHFDHTGGNNYFSTLGATIIAQQSSSFDKDYTKLLYNDKFSVNGKMQEIDIYHVESHSSSDALIHFKESNVIFMGDTFTTSWYPALFFGGIHGQTNALDVAISLADNETIIVPGHGTITDIDAVKTYKNKCIEWVSRIMALHETGLSVEDIIKDKQLKVLQLSFNNDNKPQERMDKFFALLVGNTIKAQNRLK